MPRDKHADYIDALTEMSDRAYTQWTARPHMPTLIRYEALQAAIKALQEQRVKEPAQ